MKIAFYTNHPYWGGLQPNGGSRTILLSCAVLRELGHEANVVTHTDKFKWFEHPKPWRAIPKDTDAVIAVGISDVKAVMKFKGIKAYWSRPFETWQYNEAKCLNIMSKFEKHGGKILVNSRWQYDYLFDRKMRPVICYAGLDYEKWENTRGWPRGDKPTILCQYSDKPRKKYKQFKALKKLASEFNYRTFGKDKRVTWPQLVGVYNEADYFFAPNTYEGWYNCAAEAALCGCTLVVHDCPRNGCSDFVTPENSIVYRQVGEAVERIRRGDNGDIADVQRRLAKIGTRQECMKRMVEVLQ